MDALEDLKKQAKSVLKNKELATGKNELLLAFRHSEVTNSLEKIHEYLNAFLEQLRIVTPSIEVSLEINNSGRIDGLVPGNYRLYTENSFDQLSVGFSFILQCNGQRCRLGDIKDTERDRLKNKVRHLGLEISNQPDADIEISGQMSSSLVFRSNYARRLINLTISNILNSKLQTYEIDPDSTDQIFLNNLGNYLLHRDNDFVENIIQQEKSSTYIQTYIEEQDEPEPTLTEMMESSLVNNLFKDRQKLYLTYHERIKELTSRDDGITLGRSNKCDFIVESDCASRQHATLIYRRGKFIVSDHSTNGTFIKPQGGKEIYIHREDYPLSSSGFISLGESISVDNEHLVYYSCQ
ncbi:MAG TPA: FHA domain-containing protein [Gammaproteobacteria bacterium]|nr:FHA domain-containing protein [Gammaproteobacteria bacterium]